MNNVPFLCSYDFKYVHISLSQRSFLLVINSFTYCWLGGGWGVCCGVHWLHLFRGVTPPPRVSWIWHKTIWWWSSSNAWPSRLGLWNTLHLSRWVRLLQWGGGSRLGLWNTLTASLQRGNSPFPLNKCPKYDTKQFDGEATVMLELWGMQSTSSLLPGPLWPRVGASDRVLSMGQIELNCVLMLNWIVWN